MDKTFPPDLAIGNRVWTERGYRDHGPIGGPKVDIPGGSVGVIVGIGQGYTNQLYTIRWDDGQTSTHYWGKFFSIGRFDSREEFEAAIVLEHVKLTLGPRDGFREAEIRLHYDSEYQTAILTEGYQPLWASIIKPIAMRDEIQVETTKLAPTKRERKPPR